jgi:hypothetical protein
MRLERGYLKMVILRKLILCFIGMSVLIFCAVPEGFAVEKNNAPFTFSGLGGIEKVALSEDVKKSLQQNGFVISPGYEDEIFDIYTEAKERNQSVFVTTDAVLHTAHIFFDYLSRILEIEKLYGLTNELTDKMLVLSIKQYNEAEDKEVKEAARLNIGFLPSPKTVRP